MPFLPPVDLPNPGIEHESILSLTLAGGFFTTSATWEAHLFCIYMCKFSFCVRGFEINQIINFLNSWFLLKIIDNKDFSFSILHIKTPTCPTK